MKAISVMKPQQCFSQLGRERPHAGAKPITGTSEEHESASMSSFPLQLRCAERFERSSASQPSGREKRTHTHTCLQHSVWRPHTATCFSFRSNLSFNQWMSLSVQFISGVLGTRIENSSVGGCKKRAACHCTALCQKIATNHSGRTSCTRALHNEVH